MLLSLLDASVGWLLISLFLVAAGLWQLRYAPGHRRAGLATAMLAGYATGGALVMLAACVSAPDPHPLEGSEWQLAEIHTSGSTTTLTPALQARHTLAFGPEGALALQLDCNRGRASWAAGKPRNGAGTLTITSVPSPGAVEIMSRPPRARARSRMLTSPIPGIRRGEKLKPAPSSRTRRITCSGVTARRISTSVARAWRMVLVSASCAMR